MQNCAGPSSELDTESLAPGCGMADGRGDELHGLGFSAAEGCEQKSPVRRDTGSGRLGEGRGLGDRRGRRSEVAAPGIHDPLTLKRDRQRSERTCDTGAIGLMRDDRLPVVEVPDEGGRARREHRPLESLLDRDLLLAKCVDRASELGRGGSAAVRDQGGEAVQQEIRRSRTVRRLGGRIGSAGNLVECAVCERAGEHRSPPRVEVRLAREDGIERLDLSGRGEQQPGSGATDVGDKCYLSTQQVGPGALELVELALLGYGEQLERRVECPRVQICARRRESALSAPRTIARQR